uniref:RING-type domain-containing protein n=1 Tax=Strongyloides papillosus TaxID=174720 RepID=A0A0N5B7G2_STREA
MSDAKSTPKELPILDQMRIEKELDEVVHRQRLTPQPIDFSSIPRQLFEPLIGCGICTKPIKKTLICQKCLARYCSTCISKAKFRNKDNYKCQKCHVLFDNKIKLVQDKTFDIIVEMIENQCPERRSIYPIDEVMDNNCNMKRCNLYERDKQHISNSKKIPSKLNFLSFKGDYNNDRSLVKQGYLEDDNCIVKANNEVESRPVVNNTFTSSSLNNFCNINKNGKSIYNLTNSLNNNNSLVIPYLRKEDLLCSSYESTTRSWRMLNVRLNPDINIINCFDRLGEIVRVPLYLKVSPNFKIKEFKKWALNRISELFEKQGVSSIKLGDDNIDLYWSEYKPVTLNVPPSPENSSNSLLNKRPRLEVSMNKNLPQSTQQLSKFSKRDTIINTLAEEMTIDIFINTFMEEQYKINLFVDIFFKFRTQSSNGRQ